MKANAMTTWTAAAFGAVFLLSACAKSPGVGGAMHDSKAEAPAGDVPAAATPATFAPPAGATSIGKALTQPTPMKLAALQANVAPHLQETVLVEATAEAVCQAKGCWMTVKDGEGAPIWVRWSSGCGGEFAFPKDAAGKRVVVEGTLSEKEITAEEAEHYAGESPGMDATKIAGKTFEINATACVVMPQAATS